MLLAAMLHGSREVPLYPPPQPHDSDTGGPRGSYAGFQKVGQLPRDPFGSRAPSEGQLESAPAAGSWHTQMAKGDVDAEDIAERARFAAQFQLVRVYLGSSIPAAASLLRCPCTDTHKNDVSPPVQCAMPVRHGCTVEVLRRVHR